MLRIQKTAHPSLPLGVGSNFPLLSLAHLESPVRDAPQFHPHSCQAMLGARAGTGVAYFVKETRRLHQKGGGAWTFGIKVGQGGQDRRLAPGQGRGSWANTPVPLWRTFWSCGICCFHGDPGISVSEPPRNLENQVGRRSSPQSWDTIHISW